MNEKKFIWKRTNDGTFHLFLDDPAKPDFEKQAQGKELKVIKDRTHVIIPFTLGDGICLMTLWCIIENRVFSTTLPANAEVAVVDGQTIYQIDGQWYAMIPDTISGWKERLLGEKFSVFLDCADSINYKCLYLKYFLLGKNGESVKLSRFIKGTLEISDEYREVVESGSKLIALRTDDVYDVFVPNRSECFRGCGGDAFCSFGGVYAWSEQKNGWVFHPNCSMYAKNAVYRILGERREVMELYCLEGGKLYLMAKGRRHWNPKPFAPCIEGVCYVKDEETDMVDFDNPKPTFKKRIKDFFKRN